MSRSIESRWVRGARYLALGQLAAARMQLAALEAAAPLHFRTLLLSADLAWYEGRVCAATHHALAAMRAVPDDPESLCSVVEALLRVGEVVDARECLTHHVLALAREPKWLLRLSDFRQRLDENVEALALIERAIVAGADGPEVRFHHGVQLYFNGRLSEAESALEDSFAGAPASGRTALALSRLRVQTEQHNHLGSLADALKHDVAKGSRNQAALFFARYKELEDLERYDEAWQALAMGNRLMHVRNPFDADHERAHLDRVAKTCERFCSVPCAHGSDGPQPIFILGLARSGTTVLERMLGAHSDVISAGELVDFENQLHWAADACSTRSEDFLSRLPEIDLAELGARYLAQTRWRANRRPYFIDKQPPNWAIAGLIHAALPGAKILHLVRDPMDVCFSNFRAFFGDTYAYSYDMASLAEHFLNYRRTMSNWHGMMPGKILDVSYAELVRDPESTMRVVLAFCGLGWQSGCIDMQRNPIPVATMSAAQVRQPIHMRSAGQWRRYAPMLEPLRKALERT